MITVYQANSIQEYQDYYQVFNQYLTAYPETAEAYIWSSNQDTVNVYFSEDSLFGITGNPEDLLKVTTPEMFLILICFPQTFSILSINKQELGTAIVQALNSELAQAGISETSYSSQVISNSIVPDQDKNQAHQLFAKNAFLRITEAPAEKQADIYLQFLTKANCIAVSAGLEPGQSFVLPKETIINQIIQSIDSKYENS